MIGEKLTRSDLKLVQEVQDKQVSRKPKTTQKLSLVETDLFVGKVTGFLTQTRQPDGGLFGKLESFFETF